MAENFTSRFLLALSFQVLYFRALVADPNSSFSFRNFGKDYDFESQLAFYGDAKVVNGGSSVQITDSSIPSSGRVIYREPIKLVEENPRKMVSFSTYFSFSMTLEKGDGLAFVMVPVWFPLNVFDGGSFGLLGNKKVEFLSIEFDTLMDEKYGDMNDNHVGVDVDSLVSVKASNVSSINLLLNGNEKLQVWIDYEAVSKRLEIRLSKLGEIRPLNPLLACLIDLPLLWKEEEVIVGLSSSSGNSSQRCYVYSWSFSTRTVPNWMHSEPLDPQAFEEKIRSPNVHKKNVCAFRITAALIIGTGFGAFMVLFLWTICGNGRRVPVVPEEYNMQPGKLEYKKFKVLVDKSIKDGAK